MVWGREPLSEIFSSVLINRYWLYVEVNFPFSISMAWAIPLARSISACAFSLSASSFALASSTRIWRFCSALAISAFPDISCCHTLYSGRPNIRPAMITNTVTAIRMMYFTFIFPCVQNPVPGFKVLFFVYISLL